MIVPQGRVAPFGDRTLEGGSMADTGVAQGSDIDRITDKDVYFANINAINSVRGFLALGILIIFAGTIICAILAAAIGKPESWAQVSPVIDTLLAGQFAVLGSIVAFYMTR